MAYISNARSVAGELGGKHLQNHKLVPDATAQPCYSNPRTSSSNTAPKSLHTTEGRGDGQEATEEAADEDEEDDSATLQDDDETDEDIPLSFHGRGKGKGKGKGPAIRIEPVDDDETDKDDDDASSNGTGLIPSKHPVNQLLMQNKKRTFSNLSSTSVLFGDDTTDQGVFPRRKMAKKLSNAGPKPLLTYKESDSHEHAIDSDDEDYSGVNLIPDDDEFDMETMEQQEENFIAQEQEQQATALLNQFRDARRLSLESSASDDIFGVTAPLSESYMAGLTDFGFAQFFEPEALPASPDPAAKRKYSDSSTKRVRFDDEVQVSEDSESESSELDSSVFPDLFLDQDKLPPILHQLLEAENDDDNGDVGSPMSDASFWDFNHDESRVTQADDSDDESSAGSSGYETDEGDTTDEEDFGSDVPPQTPLQKKSVLQQPLSAPGSRAGTPKPFARSNRPTGRQIPPLRGVFVHKERNAAIAVTNGATKTVTFYRPRTQAIPWIPINGTHSSTSSTANNSPRASLAQFGNVSDSEAEALNNALSTDIMLTGIFGSAPGNDYFFSNDNVGPPEAFYPFVSLGSNGSIDAFDEDDFESEDYEDDLNIGDFMDFGDDSDNSDLEDDGEETDAPTTPGASQTNGATSVQATPIEETPGNRKRTTSDVMLEHFDRGVVTAFRNNQNRYRDVASLPSDPTARNAVSRPVRSGKSADALITPLRKRSKSNRMAKSPMVPIPQSSPLASVSKTQGSMAAPRRPPPRMGTFS
ncbi:uncharacterized protein EKO05_0005060 [Ascochyta rabiei]|uniref:Uncharacterized protein n=1 Tax=Didymella rabiei TaxID=5454 RepID=A0A163BU57_DIDRA|nr:uncharacterized protein EKO05_0005060 [Ascochyta rabiei]KZM21993.1 hypothetical protein ST47_g6878 [Ascochyta rabiei]UPX14582.1 hypothetical protein EKO05_0005060 [Ascochyta rabiei]